MRVALIEPYDQHSATIDPRTEPVNKVVVYQKQDRVQRLQLRVLLERMQTSIEVPRSIVSPCEWPDIQMLILSDVCCVGTLGEKDLVAPSQTRIVEPTGTGEPYGIGS